MCGRAVERCGHHVLKSRDVVANAAVGRLLIDAEREVEAITYLERAAALDPLDAHVLLDLAYAMALGREGCMGN